MGVFGGPDIVTDGLTFSLDPVSQKNYSIDELFVEYLIAGGGGGGSGWGDGVGGGAGGVLLGSTSLARGSYSVVVGAGGARGTNSSSSRGTTGSNSSLNGLIAYGGGGGGSKVDNDGLNGGCGGGGYGDNVVPNGVGGSGVLGQGYKGGDGINFYRGGSGGGAGGPGLEGSTSDTAGLSRLDGGPGKLSTITGSEVYYGGGGAVGGCCNRGTANGGIGGGGNAGNENVDGSDGGVNTGGGGGGGGSYFNRATFGGNGGSGIVIIRYAGSQKATGGNSIYSNNGYTIHVFTSSGTFTVNNVAAGTLNPSIFDLVAIAASDSAPELSNDNKGILTFDGVNDTMALSHTFDLANPITFDIAFKFDSFANTQSTIFELRDSTYNLQLFRTSSGLCSATNKLSSPNDAPYWLVPQLNVYYFITIVLNGSNLYFYNSGIQQSSTSNLSGPVYGNRNNRLILGSRGNLDPATFFDGRIAYFRIYDKALSSNEIFSNYIAFRGRYL